MSIALPNGARSSRPGFQSRPTRPPVSKTKRPILLVDDDKDIREAIQDILEDEGYETISMKDGQAALTFLRSHPAPPLILLNWNMAPMNGPQFMVERARETALSQI